MRGRKSTWIHWDKRTTEDIKVGEAYYLSVNGKNAFQVIVLSIDKGRCWVERMRKEPAAHSNFIDCYLDELRLTPTSARHNSMEPNIHN